MKNTIKGMLMQLPVILMLLVIVIGSFYAKIAKVDVGGSTIGWETPITILIFVILYFWGRMIENSSSKNAF